MAKSQLILPPAQKSRYAERVIQRGDLFADADTGDLITRGPDARPGGRRLLTDFDQASFPTIADAAAAPIPAEKKAVRLFGFDAAGRGGADYAEVATPPAHDGKFTAADGRCFAIVQPELTPWMFGAKGNVAADRAAMQRVVAAAAETARPVLLTDGTLLMSPGDTQTPIALHGYASAPVFACIRLPSTGVTINGRGGRLIFAGSTADTPAAAAGSRNAMFATDKVSEIGARGRIRFEDIDVDFENSVSSINTPYFFFGASLRDVAFVGATFRNSLTTTRRGWAISLVNVEGLTLDRIRADRLTQLFNARWARDVRMRAISISNVLEAIDFDGVADDVQIEQIRATYNLITVAGVQTPGFGTTAEATQLIDLSSVTNVQISDVITDGYANIVGIYDKATTPPTWADGFTGTQVATPPNYRTTNRVTVRDVIGTNANYITAFPNDPAHPYINQASPLFVGISRLADGSTTGRPSPQRILFENIGLANSGGVSIKEGHVTINRLKMEGVPLQLDNGSYAALWATKQSGDNQIIADSTLRLALRDISITNASGASVFVQRPNALDLENITVDGYNLGGSLSSFATRGISITRADFEGPTVRSFGGHRVRGGVQAAGGAAPTSFAISNGDITYANPGYGIDWRGRCQFEDAVPIKVIGYDMHKHITPAREVSLGVVDVTAATSQATAPTTNPRFLVVAAGKDRVLVPNMQLILAQTIAANATNSVNYFVYRTRGGVEVVISSGNLSGGLTAGTPLDLNFSMAEPDIQLEPGDAVFVRFSRIGTGALLYGATLLVAEMRA